MTSVAHLAVVVDLVPVTRAREHACPHVPFVSVRRFASSDPSREARMSFKNTHLSFSRVSRFGSCPLSFKLQYIDQLRSEPGMPLRFGNVVHAALEALYREVIEQEHRGPLDEDRAVALLAEAWARDPEESPQIAPRTSAKTSCSRRTSTKAFISDSRSSPSIIGMAPYQ
jgi:hypothetical protein